MENDSDRRDYTYSTNFGSKSASAVSAAYIARAFDSFLGDDISARADSISSKAKSVSNTVSGLAWI